jgi:hypothetical protein
MRLASKRITGLLLGSALVAGVLGVGTIASASGPDGGVPPAVVAAADHLQCDTRGFDLYRPGRGAVLNADHRLP